MTERRTVKKSELIRNIAGATELTQKQVKEVLDATELAIQDIVRKNEEVSIFGIKISTKVQKGRDGISPMTNQPYHTEDKVVPKLKAMKSLKDACEN